jgi:hypothetical protein
MRRADVHRTRSAALRARPLLYLPDLRLDLGGWERSRCSDPIRVRETLSAAEPEISLFDGTKQNVRSAVIAWSHGPCCASFRRTTQLTYRRGRLSCEPQKRYLPHLNRATDCSVPALEFCQHRIRKRLRVLKRTEQPPNPRLGLYGLEGKHRCPGQVRRPKYTTIVNG